MAQESWPAPEQIAVLGNISESTMRAYVQLYVGGGAEGLKQVHFYCPESQLVQHVNSLEDYFRVNPPASMAALNAVTHELVTVTNDSYITSVQVCELLNKLADLHLKVQHSDYVEHRHSL